MLAILWRCGEVVRHVACGNLVCAPLRSVTWYCQGKWRALREGGCGYSADEEQTSAPSDKRHRFPPEIISHAVWLYFRFALSYRDVEEEMAERGLALTYETVRQWCRKFGQAYANRLRYRQPRPVGNVAPGRGLHAH